METKKIYVIRTYKLNNLRRKCRKPGLKMRSVGPRPFAKLTFGIWLLWSIPGVSGEIFERTFSSSESKTFNNLHSSNNTERWPETALGTKVHEPRSSVPTEADKIVLGERSSARESDDFTFRNTFVVRTGKALARDFSQTEDVDVPGLSGNGVGWSFNKSVSAAGVLEAAVYTTRIREADLSSSYSPGNGDFSEEAQSMTHSIIQLIPIQTKPDSFLKRLEFSAKDLDRMLGGESHHVDVTRLVDVRDNEFVISNPKSGAFELQQGLGETHYLFSLIPRTALSD